MPRHEQSRVCHRGVGPGNGAAFARRFALAGYRVALLARSPDVIGALEKELTGAKAYAVDLTAPDAVADTFVRIRADLGATRVLVHNATGFARGPFLDTTPADFESVWRSGPYSLLLAGQAAARQMLETGPEAGGTIIAIGATASVRGGESFAAFGASKAAHRSLAQSMARSLGPRGVHVSYVVIDGAVDTPRVRAILRDRAEGSLLKPSAIAETVFHLAQQDRSAWTFELDLRPSAEKW